MDYDYFDNVIDYDYIDFSSNVIDYDYVIVIVIMSTITITDCNYPMSGVQWFRPEYCYQQETLISFIKIKIYVAVFNRIQREIIPKYL